MQGKDTKSRMNLICGIVALLCVALMFVPMGEERGHGRQISQWVIVGQIQYAWAHCTSGFDRGNPLYGTMALLLCAAAMLLVLWALKSFRNRSNVGAMGLAAAITHILATAFALLMFMEGFDGNAFPPVMAVAGIMAIAALVMAILQKKAPKGE